MQNNMSINLKELTLEELNILQNQIVKEKDLRTNNYCIYTHRCCERSTLHLNKYKHYAKRITAIDPSKKNGYAFIGDFLSVDKQNLVPEGSYVIEVCSNNLTLYRVHEDKDELLLTGNDREYVTFIKKAKEVTGL